MNRVVKIGIVGLLVAGVLVAAMAGSVLAQEGTSPDAPKAFGFHGRGAGFGRGLCGETGLAAAADVLGMDPDELSNQLWGGNTLADLAGDADTLQAVRDAVTEACNTAREQAMRDAIAQAVTDGRITQAQADWLLEGLENGYLGQGGFFGHGRGFGGHFGRGHGFNGSFGSGRGSMRWGIPRAPSTIAPDSSA